MRPEDFQITIGERGSANVRVSLIWSDAGEVVVSNGVSSMGYRITSQEMERLGNWLLDAADRTAVKVEAVGTHCDKCADADRQALR